MLAFLPSPTATSTPSTWIPSITFTCAPSAMPANLVMSVTLIKDLPSSLSTLLPRLVSIVSILAIFSFSAWLTNFFSTVSSTRAAPNLLVSLITFCFLANSATNASLSAMLPVMLAHVGSATAF